MIKPSEDTVSLSERGQAFIDDAPDDINGVLRQSFSRSGNADIIAAHLLIGPLY